MRNEAEAKAAQSRVAQGHGSEATAELPRESEVQRELAEVRERLVQAEKLASLGRFVAGIVHELNNPLTSIIASVSQLGHIARQRNPDPLTQRELSGLHRIDEAAQRILEFSQDLVSYARPAAGNKQAVSLHRVISKALSFCQHVFSERKIAVHQDLPMSLPSVVGHESQLTQVFINLFTNAAHAAPSSGGQVVVRAQVVQDSILIQVRDNGRGIEAAHLSRVFEPFFTTKSEGEGSGLGLSIAQEIVAVHGGTLEVQSSRGQGTVFCISLPCA